MNPHKKSFFRNPRRLPLGLFILTMAWTCFALTAAPNIVFLMADDLGYGDVQPLNPQSKIPTPHFNRLAGEGMTFTDSHTPSAVCTPTRYGVVTGRYCWRTRMKRGVLNGYSSHLIDPDRLTVADLLARRGYETAIVGKWHLGLDFARGEGGKEFDFTKPVNVTPNDYGFRHSYIIPASLDFPPYLYVKNRDITETPSILQPKQNFPAFLREGERSPDLVMEECLDHLTEQALGFLRQRGTDGKPFFLYFPLTAPHKPVLPHPRFRDRSGLGPYGDFVIQVDATLGKVLDVLDESGLTDDTLLFVTSDNGSFMYRRDDPQAADHVSDETIQAYRSNHHRSNFHYRGTKADIWEAGHRTPFFARWPGHVRAGSREDRTICLTDFFATCAELTGQALPDDAAEDSFSLLPLLTGKGEWKRAPVIHHSGNGVFAIRDGAYKLVLGNGSGGREQPRGEPFGRPFHLYNLNADPGETFNRVEWQGGIASRLERAARAIIDSGTSRLSKE